MVLESWDHSRSIVGAIYDLIAEPGSTPEIELSVQVPGDLVPGVYVCGVVAVINGGLSFRKYFVSISA
jgi:hypothetical protein